jgi:hypothetical protein
MSYAFVLPPVPRFLRPEDRSIIEAQIEALIELLDQEDGDCDLEEDDWAGGAVEDQPHDLHENLIPIYGIDQALGPINEVVAIEAYRRRAFG